MKFVKKHGFYRNVICFAVFGKQIVQAYKRGIELFGGTLKREGAGTCFRSNAFVYK